MQLVKGQLLLDLGNSKARVQTLRTGSGTVHDGMTSVQGHGVLQHLLSDLRGLVSRVNQPSVGLHQHSRTQVLLLVPPVGRTGSGAARTQNTFIKTIQLGSVLHTLKVFSAICRRGISLQVWLDRLVLLVEVGQIWHKVTHNVHVRQGVHLCVLGGVCVDSAQTSQSVGTTNIHGTRSTNTFSARSSKRQGGILFVFDFQKGIQNHGSTLIQIHLISLHLRLHLRGIWVPAVNLELFDSLFGIGGQVSAENGHAGHGTKGRSEHFIYMLLLFYSIKEVGRKRSARKKKWEYASLWECVLYVREVGPELSYFHPSVCRHTAKKFDLNVR